MREHSVELDTQRCLPYDGLIIATGVVPRRLPFGHDLAGVHVLRTLDDALALRAQLQPGKRLVVVGGGFLGCDGAAVACRAGLQVSIVDPVPVPMLAHLGGNVGRQVANLHHENGVKLLFGQGVERLLGDVHVTHVELESGTALPADLVLVAVGSRPATDWLADSGLAIEDGVVCDSTCCAAPGVYAAGDVARWWHPELNRHIRIEHRLNAAEQAIAGATNLVGAGAPFLPVPYFWTDQYDARIQAYGICSGDCSVSVVRGDPSQGRFIAHYAREGRISGVLAWNMPKELRAERVNIGRHQVDVT
ncbi:NAD(P)/FAD-dependent oxidoreductase [Bacillus subtilis]